MYRSVLVIIKVRADAPANVAKEAHVWNWLAAGTSGMGAGWSPDAIANGGRKNHYLAHRVGVEHSLTCSLSERTISVSIPMRFRRLGSGAARPGGADVVTEIRRPIFRLAFLRLVRSSPDLRRRLIHDGPDRYLISKIGCSWFLPTNSWQRLWRECHFLGI